MGAALAVATAGPAGPLSELDSEHGGVGWALAEEPWSVHREIPSFHAPCPVVMVPSSSVSLRAAFPRPGSSGPAVLGDPF